MGRLIPVASTAFRCRDSLRLARPPQQIVAAAFVFRSGTLVVTNSYDDTTSYHRPQEALMNGLIYLIGLIVVIMAILSFLGLH